MLVFCVAISLLVRFPVESITISPSTQPGLMALVTMAVAQDYFLFSTFERQDTFNLSQLSQVQNRMPYPNFQTGLTFTD